MYSYDLLVFFVSRDFFFPNKHLETFFVEVVFLVSEGTWCFCGTIFVPSGSAELLV